MNNTEKEEYQVIVVTPERCSDCEGCMTICSYVHERDYIPLERRVVGIRDRLEPEWAISCDMCKGMKEHYIDPEVGKVPQCIQACPNNAIFIGIIEAINNESRLDAIKRIFNIKS